MSSLPLSLATTTGGRTKTTPEVHERHGATKIIRWAVSFPLWWFVALIIYALNLGAYLMDYYGPQKNLVHLVLGVPSLLLLILQIVPGISRIAKLVGEKQLL